MKLKHKLIRGNTRFSRADVSRALGQRAGYRCNVTSFICRSVIYEFVYYAHVPPLYNVIYRIYLHIPSGIIYITFGYTIFMRFIFLRKHRCANCSGTVVSNCAFDVILAHRDIRFIPK